MSIASKSTTFSDDLCKSRKAAISDHPSIFADIYQDDVNIAIWQRDLSDDIKACAKSLLRSHSLFEEKLIVTPDNAYLKLLNTESKLKNFDAFCLDIAELVNMFCLLHDLEKAGLRLAMLDTAMCPRFHVDRVLCRLICTYHGTATEWLMHDKVDRRKLGGGNNGQADEKSGHFANEKDINHLMTGDVAMLKGELWRGNNNAGLVHRSPDVPKGEKRLLLTLDII